MAIRAAARAICRWAGRAANGRQAQISRTRSAVGPSNYNYVDSIRTSELVPAARKVPPGGGWRRALYNATFGLVNLGQSPDELRQAELEAKIRTQLAR